LGEAVAARFVSDGHDVVLVDVAPEVRATADRLGGGRERPRVLGLVGDVSSETDVERVMSLALEEMPGLDALVNNAGVGGGDSTVAETSLEDFRHVIDVNLIGTFLMARAAGRVLLRQGTGGAIVNLGSILGQRGEAGGAAYSASKAGVALLTQVLALELAPYGIRVNTVAPGNMASEMHWDYVRSIASAERIGFEEAKDKVRATVPLGRHGTGEDIAGAVAWLCSEDASYVTGQTIGVNGGVVLT
jgi:NAD(P)-dependent dehydrogenase (short-subunit alcohol dehydrogenase family)